MPLPTNPDFQFRGTTWSTVDAIGQANPNSGDPVYSSVDQGRLNQTIAEYSGAPGSNLNYIANGAPNTYTNANSGVTTVASTAYTGSGGGGTAGGSSGGGGGSGIDKALGAIATGLALFGAARNIGAGLQTALSNISAAAGAVGNILSKKRGANIPAKAETKTDTPKVEVTPAQYGDWKIRLRFPQEIFDNSPIFKPLVATDGLIWPYVPNVSITYKANYTQVDTIHNNFPFQAYKNSTIDDITISGEFSVQTPEEAKYWIAANQFLRSATKMFYGESKFKGNPPIVCKLSGYGSYVFNNIPVIIKSFNVELKDDVNYISTLVAGQQQWVPTLSNISVTVTPVYQRDRLKTFSLQDFASGKTIGYM